MVESVSAGIRLLDIFRLLNGIKGDNLHPIPIGVECKCNASHATISQFLLEFVAGVFDPLAGSLDGVYADANVAEAFAWLGVAVGDFETVVFLRAVVVSQFQDSLASGPVLAAGEALGGVVGKKVQIEFGIRVLDLVDLFHAKELIVLDWAQYQISGRRMRDGESFT